MSENGKEAARKRLLEPLSESEAQNFRPVTEAEILEALRRADGELRPHEAFARSPAFNPAVRYC